MPRPDADRQTFAGTCSRLLESIRERIEEQEEETLRLYRELARERTERLDRIIRVGNREYRLTTALGFVEFNVSRRADEPARARNYEPGLRLAPSLSFLVLFRPCQWRFAREDGAVCPEAGRPEGETIQIASLGLSLVLAVGENVVPRFGLGAVMLFFDDIVGFSVGVDLYRAIPVLESGRSTFAHTGLLAAAAATEGEVTPENFWIGLILNVESLLSVLQGGRP
ncbi:MAG: hypothetical protein K8H88_06060 [Sandaracinaceae bacterium]|nr:hypothetical protein [Sandaracinaceae bacterium]